MKKVTSEQKKIIYISSISVGFLLFFWFFVYIPQSRQLTKIKKQITLTENKISDITKITEGKNLVEIVTSLNVGLKGSLGNFGAGEDETIKYLSESARKLKIELKDFVFSDKEILQDGVVGYKLEELLISMNFKANYMALGEYLEILRNNPYVLFSIKKLDIKGSGEGNSRLDINLQVYAYICKES